MRKTNKRQRSFRRKRYSRYSKKSRRIRKYARRARRSQEWLTKTFRVRSVVVITTPYVTKTNGVAIYAYSEAGNWTLDKIGRETLFYKNNYDYYKIGKITMINTLNVQRPGDAATEATFGKTEWYTFSDHDDTNVEPYDRFLIKPGVARYNLSNGKPAKHSYYPHPNLILYNGVTTSGYGFYNNNPWISTHQSALPHYGFKNMFIKTIDWVGQEGSPPSELQIGTVTTDMFYTVHFRKLTNIAMNLTQADWNSFTLVPENHPNTTTWTDATSVLEDTHLLRNAHAEALQTVVTAPTQP